MCSPSAAWLVVVLAPYLTDHSESKVRQAIDRSLPLLAQAATGHTENRTCFACHNQSFPLLAMDLAGRRGFKVPATLRAEQAEHITDFLGDNREKFEKGQGTGGQVDTAGYAMLALEMAQHPRDETTRAVVSYLLQFPKKQPYWRTSSNRPPTEASHFTATYVALRALRVWAEDDQQAEAKQRRNAARTWLQKTQPRDTEDRVFRLLSMLELEMERKAIEAARDDLLAQQRPDGGWGQLESLASDAYATGTVLYALAQADPKVTASLSYRNGVGFLLAGQQADGSWHVRSRSKPFQKYYESGFPHGTDQFIAVTASSWATAALLLTLPEQRSETSKR